MEKENVLRLIREHPLGCDLIFSFFASAVNSIRSDSCVRPFPPMYYKGNSEEKDFTSLELICNDLPSLKELNYQQNYGEHIKLLNWLYTKCNPRLYRLCKEEDLPLDISGYRPKYIFSVNYSLQSEEVWNSRKEYSSTSYGFHGSHLDRFYSILRVGLQQIFSTNTNPLYGEGIYLSKQLPVSIVYAPYGTGWSNSIIGQSMSVVAICEYIDDPSKRKCARDSRGSIIKHMAIIKDSDSLRIRYLLVFAKKFGNVEKSVFRDKMLVIIIVFFAVFICYMKFIQV